MKQEREMRATSALELLDALACSSSSADRSSHESPLPLRVAAATAAEAAVALEYLVAMQRYDRVPIHPPNQAAKPFLPAESRLGAEDGRFDGSTVYQCNC